MVPALTIILCSIFLTGFVRAQDTKNDTQKKTVKIKVVKEKDGKKSVLDTTIIGTESLKEKDIDAMMEKLEKEMKGLESEMKKLDLDISVTLDDTGKIDSLKKEIRKVIMLGNGCCKGKVDIDCIPHCFNFGFDNIPEIFEGVENEGNWEDVDGNIFYYGTPGPEFNFRTQQKHSGGTLSDILGDIPMDRVKNYSIKETKNGKKITIEVDHGPLFESRGNVVVIKDPYAKKKRKSRHGTPEQDVKVIIKTDTDEKSGEKTPVPEKPEEKL
jgi:hypothetical protein